MYKINKGVGKSAEFYGLRGTWMYTFLGGMGVVIFLFFGLVSSGFPSLLAVLFTLILASIFCLYVFRANEKYGEFGLLKFSARKKIPHCIVIRNPTIFQNLKTLEK